MIKSFLLACVTGIVAHVSFSQMPTYTKCPLQKQVYQRNNSNQCSVEFEGSTTHEIVRFKVYKRLGMSSTYVFQQTVDETVVAGLFSYAHPIMGEMAEWRFEVYGVNGGVETLLQTFSDVICGEIFIVAGQSNAVNSVDDTDMGTSCDGAAHSRYNRAYGKQLIHESDCANWSGAGWGKSSSMWTSPYFAGGWACKIQKDILDAESIPTGVVNIAVGGTGIAEHLPGGGGYTVPSPCSMTIWDAAISKLESSGIKSGAEAIFWYQGEDEVSHNITCAFDYYDLFLELRQNWYNELPSLDQIYVLQLNTACNIAHSNTTNEKRIVREAHLMIGEALSDVQLITTFGVVQTDFETDQCHYLPSGSCKLGDRSSPLYREFITNTVDESGDDYPPRMLHAVYYSGSNAIVMTFDRTVVAVDPNTGDAHLLKDFFYNQTGQQLATSSISVSGSVVTLSLSPGTTVPEAISYLPNSWNNLNSNLFYGPWLMNSTQKMAVPSYYNFEVIGPAELAGGWVKSWGYATMTDINTCSFNFATHNNDLYNNITIGGTSCVNTQPSGDYTWLRARATVTISGTFTSPLGAQLTIETLNESSICE